MLFRSRVLPGNVSEPGTLKTTLEALQATGYSNSRTRNHPHAGITVVMDAGIATQDNLQLLREQNYDYVVVSRKKPELSEENRTGPKVIVKQDQRNIVKVKRVIQDQEAILFCQSKMKAVKEQKMRTLLENRFEQDLKRAAEALAIKGGVKTYDKVKERVDRLLEKHKRVSQYYQITIQQQGPLATAISWTKINQEREEQRFSGSYYLRSSRTDLNEKEIWSLYIMLTNLEDAFRSLKSELNLRPLFHQKEPRSDAHIFIAVLAYHLLNVIQTELRKNKIHIQWWRVRERLSSQIRITTCFTTLEQKRYYIRKTSQAESFHKIIYNALGLRHNPMKTKRYDV